MSMVSSRRRLLLGFGDIGRRLGKLSVVKTISTTAVRRSKMGEKFADVDVQAGDVTQADTLKKLLSEGPADICITLTPDNYSEKGYRDSYLACAETLASVLPSHSPDSRVIYVSSTSVYSQNAGELVDEQTDCSGDSSGSRRSPTAKILLLAEQAITSGGFSHCNLRFSGIYGPGRTRLIESVRGGNIAAAQPIQWTNRIHADDCAGVIDFLFSLPEKHLPKVLIGTDCASAPKKEVQLFIANQLGMNVSAQTSNFDLSPANENDLSNDGQKGKRCSNQRLLDLGYNFLYPDYQAGFSALLS